MASNCSKHKNQTKTALNTTAPFKIDKSLGVANAEATGNFLQPGTSVQNLHPTKNPITISQPDGSKLISTHECDIDNPELPPKARAAHIVPGMAHTSLLSIKMLVDAGCNVRYQKDRCT